MRQLVEKAIAGLVVWLIHSMVVFVGLVYLLTYGARWHVAWWLTAKHEPIYTGTLMFWPHIRVALTPSTVLLCVLGIASGILGAIVQQIVWSGKTRGRGKLAEIRRQDFAQGYAKGTPTARAKARTTPVADE